MAGSLTTHHPRTWSGSSGWTPSPGTWPCRSADRRTGLAGRCSGARSGYSAHFFDRGGKPVSQTWWSEFVAEISLPEMVHQACFKACADRPQTAYEHAWAIRDRLG